MQRVRKSSLHGLVNKFVARPLGGEAGTPARWVTIRDVADPSFLARNGTLFQYNKGELIVPHA
jgi:hypothetical protein